MTDDDWNIVVIIVPPRQTIRKPPAITRKKSALSTCFDAGRQDFYGIVHMLQGFVVCKSVKKRRGIVFTFDFKLPFFFFCEEAFKQAATFRVIINFTIPRVVIALDLSDG